ncbi:hypothetical protein [Catellatospora paridis]|uniref:hypothetical protein n=1 Tax=Catellatospora paridis TaxID=1617086 RepID=UPI001E4EDE77|nr:hypothetical protein [Catellatospora paridis]
MTAVPVLVGRLSGDRGRGCRRFVQGRVVCRIRHPRLSQRVRGARVDAAAFRAGRAARGHFEGLPNLGAMTDGQRAAFFVEHDSFWVE